MKTVSPGHTRLMNPIYLSPSSQVAEGAEGTVLMKRIVCHPPQLDNYVTNIVLVN